MNTKDPGLPRGFQLFISATKQRVSDVQLKKGKLLKGQMNQVYVSRILQRRKVLASQIRIDEYLLIYPSSRE